MISASQVRAPRNRTIDLTDADRDLLSSRLIRLAHAAGIESVRNRTICQDALQALDYLPDGSIDLLFADPPYNLTKVFNEVSFAQMDLAEYESWLEAWVGKAVRLLKRTASIYICGDWRSSTAIHRVANRHFHVRNRITWEREKGRGAAMNWKNASEDIWFCTNSEDFKFYVDRVKLKRRIIAPYVDGAGQPKDWTDTPEGKFRLTHPSNLWTDLTVPFWSMRENTDHPTQKPEKLLAKIILASSDEGDVVLDPFAGSGTTSVVAKKLSRNFIAIELDQNYACIAEKRLALVPSDPTIQGYRNGVFWEKNSLGDPRGARQPNSADCCPSLFES